MPSKKGKFILQQYGSRYNSIYHRIWFIPQSSPCFLPLTCPFSFSYMLSWPYSFDGSCSMMWDLLLLNLLNLLICLVNRWEELSTKISFYFNLDCLQFWSDSDLDPFYVICHTVFAFIFDPSIYNSISSFINKKIIKRNQLKNTVIGYLMTHFSIIDFFQETSYKCKTRIFEQINCLRVFISYNQILGMVTDGAYKSQSRISQITEINQSTT